MKSFDLNRPISAHALNESMFKQFNVKIDFNKYDREQLENYRNLLRSKVHATETQANFNDLLTNETYQKDKYMLGVLNTKIKEMLGEAKKSKPDANKDGIPDYAQDGKGSKDLGKGKGGAPKKGVNPFAKVKEAAKPLKGGQKKLDTDKDGDIDAKDMKNLRSKKQVKESFAREDVDMVDDFVGSNKSNFKGRYNDDFEKVQDNFTKFLAKKGLNADAIDDDGYPVIVATSGGHPVAWYDLENAVGYIEKTAPMESKSELLHKAYQQFIAEGIATYIAEDEEGKAKSITAAADMVNDFTSWMQRVGNYQTKSMIELADNIRANFGMQEAETFKQTVGSALEGALNALTTAREEINNAVAVLAGEAPAQEPMGMDPEAGMEEPGMDMSAPDEMNMPGDEFAAADAAAGGDMDTGRMKRESIERGNRLMKILGS